MVEKREVVRYGIGLGWGRLGCFRLLSVRYLYVAQYLGDVP
jgi:hypothetical protein